MDAATLQVLAGQWGPMGLLIGYLLWSDHRRAVAQDKMDEKKGAERLRLEEKRIAFDRERLECDKALAAGLAALTAVIQGRK